MQQRSLVLILARDLADKLGSATFVVDQEGRLLYFNESAERILGRSFGEVGEMAMADWALAFVPFDLDDRPLSPEELPLVVALRDHRPSHRAMRIRGMDGEMREIAVTAIPLFAREGEVEGGVAIFWEHQGRPGGGDRDAEGA